MKFFIFCSVFTLSISGVSGGEGYFYSGKEPIGGKTVCYTELGDSYNALTQANNPLAEVRTYGITNYYLADFDGFSGDANAFVLRYVEPFSFGGFDWVLRTALPINHFPDGTGGEETGLGDFQMYLPALFDVGNPNVSFGFGPLLSAPTATDASLGSDKWSAGVANTYFNATSDKFQFGYSLGWRHSFAGSDTRNRVSQGLFQPMAFYQLGNGWYTGSSATWSYDFRDDSYSIPVGLRLGKVVENENRVSNFFVEPQYTVFQQGASIPQWQIVAGLQIQLLK